MKNVLLFFALSLPYISTSQSYFKGLVQRMDTPILLSLGSGFFDGVGETALFHYEKSIFKKCGKWCNPNESWKLKYKDWPNNKRAAFPLSKTALVGFTDMYHASKTVSLTMNQVIPVYYHRPRRKIEAVYDVILMKIAYGVGWELSNWIFTY